MSLSSKSATTYADGLLLVDKPAGLTSFDVIRRLRRQTGVRKIGHTGTLDPMASGLMVILFGTATKHAQQLTKLNKAYTAELMLGFTSTTGDGEGEVRHQSSHIPTSNDVQDALRHFTGPITQIPPVYSAIKVNGTRAYKLARQGVDVVMPPREVTVHSLELSGYEYPQVVLYATVSSGTYIRSLAQDIGEQLQVGAYLKALRRTAVGEYFLSQAAMLESITGESLSQHLRPLV